MRVVVQAWGFAGREAVERPRITVLPVGGRGDWLDDGEDVWFRTVVFSFFFSSRRVCCTLVSFA